MAEKAADGSVSGPSTEVSHADHQAMLRRFRTGKDQTSSSQGENLPETPYEIPFDIDALSYPTLTAIDVTAALGSAIPCASLVCMIDKAVTENASGKATMLSSLKNNMKSMLTEPLVFFRGKAFLAVAIVYGGTYVAANTSNTWTEKTRKKSPLYQLSATTAVNIALGVTKDSLFAKWYGVSAPPKFPPSCWSLFVMRDVLTVFAGFTIPPRVADVLHQGGYVNTKKKADVISQLVCPIAFQFVLTPMHLLALDMYNRPSEANRFPFIKQILPESLAIRMARFGLVYGVGGVGNKSIRQTLRKKLLPY